VCVCVFIWSIWINIDRRFVFFRRRRRSLCGLRGRHFALAALDPRCSKSVPEHMHN